MKGLDEFRVRLNAIDDDLIELLGRRFAICREVANYKRVHDIPMMQSARVEEVKRRCADLGLKHNLDPQFTMSLYSLIIDEACKVEDEIIDHPGSIQRHVAEVEKN